MRAAFVPCLCHTCSPCLRLPSECPSGHYYPLFFYKPYKPTNSQTSSFTPSAGLEEVLCYWLSGPAGCQWQRKLPGFPPSCDQWALPPKPENIYLCLRCRLVLRDTSKSNEQFLTALDGSPVLGSSDGSRPTSTLTGFPGAPYVLRIS